MMHTAYLTNTDKHFCVEGISIIQELSNQIEVVAYVELSF